MWNTLLEFISSRNGPDQCLSILQRTFNLFMDDRDNRAYCGRSGWWDTSLTSDDNVECYFLVLQDLHPGPPGLILWIILRDSLLDWRTRGLALGHKSDVLLFHRTGLNINFQSGVSVTKSSVLVNADGDSALRGGNEFSLLTVRISTPSCHREFCFPQCLWQ